MQGNYRKSGFTIVELLIVIVVIAILAAIIIVAYNGVQMRARDSKRVTDLTTVQKALEMYYADNGRYPATSTEVSGLASFLVPKYISSLPVEPDGSTVRYRYVMGWRKSGPMNHVNAPVGEETQYYSMGTYLEAKGCPCTSHWSTQINYMVGN